MTIIKRILCLGILALGAIAAAVCISACGGSSSSKTTSASSSKETAFVSCLEKHGVSSSVATSFGKHTTGGFTHGKNPHGKAPGGTFPKGKAAHGGTAPKAGAGAFFGSGGGTHKGFATSSKFTAAMKDCDSKLGKSAKAFAGGGAGFGGKRPSGKFKPRFNTKTLDKFVSCIRRNGYATMPEPKKSSTSGAFFPKSVENNAGFKKALPKCESILRAGFRSGRSSSTTTGSSS